MILTIDEFNTTKLCPRCHNPTQYANPQREIRSKMCNHEECKSVDRHGNEHDFAYDRDFGAATNMYFVAQFMARARRADAQCRSGRHGNSSNWRKIPPQTKVNNVSNYGVCYGAISFTSPADGSERLTFTVSQYEVASSCAFAMINNGGS